MSKKYHDRTLPIFSSGSKNTLGEVKASISKLFVEVKMLRCEVRELKVMLEQKTERSESMKNSDWSRI